jgi:putative oxidoreductase
MANNATGLTDSIRSRWGKFEVRILDRLAPIADLVARLYIAKVFFSSGWNKITDWESTLFLFREEYHVPLLPPELAAVLGTGGELFLSVMLALGLFTRFSACGLFVLNIVAVVSYYGALQESPAAIQDHLQWAIIIALLLVGQVRALTVDHLVLRRFFRPG